MEGGGGRQANSVGISMVSGLVGAFWDLVLGTLVL